MGSPLVNVHSATMMPPSCKIVLVAMISLYCGSPFRSPRLTYLPIATHVTTREKVVAAICAVSAVAVDFQVLIVMEPGVADGAAVTNCAPATGSLFNDAVTKNKSVRPVGTVSDAVTVVQSPRSMLYPLLIFSFAIVLLNRGNARDHRAPLQARGSLS